MVPASRGDLEWAPIPDVLTGTVGLADRQSAAQSEGWDASTSHTLSC